MKKILIFIAIGFSAIISFAQTKIGSYYSGSFTIDLSSQERNTVWDSIAAIRGYPGSTLDSVVFDDQDPATIDSASYVVFYGDYHGTKITVGFYLTKQSIHGAIVYFIDDDNSSVERAWECTPTEGCASQACKPHRKWFLGNVVSCKCVQSESTPCTLVNSGNGFPWSEIIGILGIILPLLI